MNTAIELNINTATAISIATGEEVVIPETVIYIKEDSDGTSQWDDSTQQWIRTE
jgi:hypothetical protein